MTKITRLSWTQDVGHTADWLDDQPTSVELPAGEASELATIEA